MSKAGSWSSSALFHVNIKSVISLICKHGSFAISKSIEKDLKVIESVCDCDDATLDLFKRELLFQNFTVSLPQLQDHGNSLQVGRFSIKWDSYLKPCIEIEVEDVDILVEFVNLILTKTNWNELKDIDFPPLFYDPTDLKPKETIVSPSFVSTLIRIGSVHMNGEVRLKIRSRPLDANLVEDIVFDLRRLKDMMNKIVTAAERGREKSGRRGCTTEELYDIIQSYFEQQVKQLLREATLEIASAALDGRNSKTIGEVQKLWSGAKDTAANYAKIVTEKADSRIDENLKELGLEKSNILDLAGAFWGRKGKDSSDDGYSDVYVVDSEDM